MLRIEAQVDEPEALITGLNRHPDFDETPDGFTWLGKEMSQMHREAALAEARKVAAHASKPITP